MNPLVRGMLDLSPVIGKWNWHQMPSGEACRTRACSMKKQTVARSGFSLVWRRRNQLLAGYQKAESLVKIWTKFLDMVTKRQIEKTTKNLLFSLFIQFSAIEIRWVFLHAKLTISWLLWLEKKVGCPCSLVSYTRFFNWQSSMSRQFRHVFNVRVHEGALNDAINYLSKLSAWASRFCSEKGKRLLRNMSKSCSKVAQKFEKVAQKFCNLPCLI